MLLLWPKLTLSTYVLILLVAETKKSVSVNRFFCVFIKFISAKNYTIFSLREKRAEETERYQIWVASHKFSSTVQNPAGGN